jgi:LPS-assembly lipoprotein
MSGPSRLSGMPLETASPLPVRRVALVAALASCAALLLATSGCGFELKRAPELHFRTILLTGFAVRSPLAAELKASISASPTTVVVDGIAQAQVVLEALADVRERNVVATTTAGQVREYQLRSRLKFRLRTASGRELIPESEISLTRDMSFTESAALAKEQEEALLYRAMQTDIVNQVLRRLATVQLL